jgi:hypothetical protein
MGDRTNVDLTIRKIDQRKFEALCDDFNGKFEGEMPPSEVPTIEYEFNDVNYAELEIESALQKEKIPYDKVWGQGGEYDAGIEYHRIGNNGESIIKQFYEGKEGMVSLDDVEKAFELGTVDKYIKKKRNEFHVISWKEQDAILSKLNL